MPPGLRDVAKQLRRVRVLERQTDLQQMLVKPGRPLMRC